ncbi:MAG: SET domain-containing protein-lysine N-methyltransferase [Rhabdochlamydiaceae bacterium]
MDFYLDRCFFPLPLIKIIKRQKTSLPQPLSSFDCSALSRINSFMKAQQDPPYFIKKWINAQIKEGIFLHPMSYPLEKGEIVACYAGELELEEKKMCNQDSYTFHLLEEIVLTKKEQYLLGGEISYDPQKRYTLKVNAEKKGNFTRFINHSEKPNVMAYLTRIKKNVYGLEPSLIEIVFVARKRIHPGCQLLIDYGQNYWARLGVDPFPLLENTYRLDSNLNFV